MNKPASVADAQLQHLLEVVERHREARCDELLAQARQRAAAILKEAHRQARGRMRESNDELRLDMRQQLRSAEAQRQTRARQRRQQAAQKLLLHTWEPLREALLARWRDPAARRRWVQHLSDQALAVLVSRQWEIQHPVDWAETERLELEKRLLKALGERPAFRAEASLIAGLKICADGTCVDGTVEGLMRARTPIEAMLLSRINRSRLLEE
jgi:F0F1-type ATP synthase membrane subunit b/b'